MGRFSPTKGDYATVILLHFACDGAKLRLCPGTGNEQGGILLLFFAFFSISRRLLAGQTGIFRNSRTLYYINNALNRDGFRLDSDFQTSFLCFAFDLQTGASQRAKCM